MFQSFPTGGSTRWRRSRWTSAGNGLESLVIANAGDGLITLLGGTREGLSVEATLSPAELARAVLAGPGLPSPATRCEFYATTEGVEAASLISIDLSPFF